MAGRSRGSGWAAVLFLGMALSAVIPAPARGAAAPPNTAAIPVQGQVVGPDGRGVAGAQVELRRVPAAYDWIVRNLEGVGDPPPLAKAASGADGAFLVRAPEAGLGRVLVRAPGYVPMLSPLLVIHEEVRLPLLRLERDAGLRVRVQDAAGRPVSGARVVGVANPESRPVGEWGWAPFGRNGVTGADGAVLLARAEDEVLRPRVIAPLHPPQWGPAVARSSCLVKLAPGLLAAVQVQSEAGPLPDLVVRDPETGLAIDQSRGGPEAGPNAGSLLVAVPPRGRASFDILTRDGRRVPLYFGGEEKEGAKTLAKSLALRTVRLPAAGVVVGRVIDGKTRQPVADAYVWPAADPGAYVRADRSGRFRLAGPAAYEWAWLEAAAPGRSRAEQPFLSLREAGTGLPEIVLEARHSLAGTVVDERGRPLAGAEVWTARGDEGWGRPGVTDSAGRFRLPDLDDGIVDLRVALRGFQPVVRAVEVGERDVRVVLRSSRTAFGVVQDQQGEPFAGLELELRVQDQGRASPRDRWSYQAITGPDGSFEVADLPAGWLSLEVASPEAGLRKWPVEIPEEGEARVDLGVFTTARKAGLTGRVVDPKGEPVAGARIWNRSRSPYRYDHLDRRVHEKEARSDLEGRFTLPGAGDEGAVFLEVERHGFGRVVREVSPADGPVEIVLQPAARITGWVLTSEGRALPGARIAVTPAQPEGSERSPQMPREFQAITDTEGYFAVEDQAGGAFVLKATASGYLPGEELRLQVEAGRSYEGLEVVLRRGATVTGRILREDGEPVSQALVYWIDAPGVSQFARSSPRGEYVLSGVEPGERPVTVSHPDFREAQQTVELRPGENRLDWILARKELRPVRGRVLDVEGLPAVGALVSLSGSQTQRVLTGPDGYFEVSVAEGFYHLQADKEGLLSAEVPLEVTPDPVEEVELQLVAPASLSGRILGVDDPLKVHLRAVVNGRQSRLAQIFEDGSYQITGLTGGNWYVEARDGQRNLFLPVTLPREGGNTELDIQFAPLAEVLFRLVDLEGRPVPSVRILFVYGVSGGVPIIRQSGPDGTLTLSLQEGLHSIGIPAPAQYGLAQESWVTVTREEPVVEIRLRPNGEPVPPEGEGTAEEPPGR